VVTGCPDNGLVDLSAVEYSVQAESDPIDGGGNGQSLCYSEWLCVCVRVGERVPSAVGVISNGTHGAVLVSRGEQEGATGVVSVRVMPSALLSPRKIERHRRLFSGLINHSCPFFKRIQVRSKLSAHAFCGRLMRCNAVLSDGALIFPLSNYGTSMRNASHQSFLPALEASVSVSSGAAPAVRDRLM
jgi:hypothetical protein